MTNSNNTDRVIQQGPRKLRMTAGGVLTILLAITGLSIALYLSYLHLTLLLGEVQSVLLCGEENELGCHTVAASPHSYLLGVPLSVWGAFFYVLVSVLALGGIIFGQKNGATYYRWAFYLACLGLAFDGYLGYIMVTKIQAICRLCVGTYAINVGIVLTLIGALWKAPKEQRTLLWVLPRLRTKDDAEAGAYYENVVKWLLIVGMLIPLLILSGSTQILTHVLTVNDKKSLEKFKERYAEQEARVIGVDGRPSLGAEDAEVTVVEFSDFRCPYCKRVAQYVEIVAASYRDSVRFVFRHMPLDSGCNPYVRRSLHPGACELAAGAACADEQDRFWAYHDVAFHTEGEVTTELLGTIAQEAELDMTAFRECLDSDRGREIVRQDIETAVKLGVTSTPTMFINGRALRGGVRKPWVLEKILDHARENP